MPTFGRCRIRKRLTVSGRALFRCDGPAAFASTTTFQAPVAFQAPVTFDAPLVFTSLDLAGTLSVAGDTTLADVTADGIVVNDTLTTEHLEVTEGTTLHGGTTLDGLTCSGQAVFNDVTKTFGGLVGPPGGNILTFSTDPLTLAASGGTFLVHNTTQELGYLVTLPPTFGNAGFRITFVNASFNGETWAGLVEFAPQPNPDGVPSPNLYGIVNNGGTFTTNEGPPNVLVKFSALSEANDVIEIVYLSTGDLFVQGTSSVAGGIVFADS
jgi:hypothetical protein